MGIALSTPELRALTEKLAHKYKLAISPLSKNSYFGETYMEMWGEPVKTKKSAFLQYVNHLDPKKPNLVVIHTWHPQSEMTPGNDTMLDEFTGRKTIIQSAPPDRTEHVTSSPEFMDLIGKIYRPINQQTAARYKDIAFLYLKVEIINNGFNVQCQRAVIGPHAVGTLRAVAAGADKAL
jgi:hypothetical protein